MPKDTHEVPDGIFKNVYVKHLISIETSRKESLLSMPLAANLLDY